MKIFLDTANIDDIRTAAKLGVVDGITTNPSLVAKEGVQYKDRILEIAEVIDGPLSAECVSLEISELCEEARRVASWHPNVVVKIPMGKVGLEAISTLSSEGIKINCTLIFSVNQAFLAAKAGAAFVSPFIGRLNDGGADGMILIRECATIFDNYPDISTEILAASIRGPRDVTDVALAGAHVATIPPNVLAQMIEHPLTDRGIDAFLADAKSYDPV